MDYQVQAFRSRHQRAELGVLRRRYVAVAEGSAQGDRVTDPHERRRTFADRARMEAGHTVLLVESFVRSASPTFRGDRARQNQRVRGRARLPLDDTPATSERAGHICAGPKARDMKPSQIAAKSHDCGRRDDFVDRLSGQGRRPSAGVEICCPYDVGGGGGQG